MVNAARLAARVVTRDYVRSPNTGLSLLDKSLTLGGVGAFILIPFKKFFRFNRNG